MLYYKFSDYLKNRYGTRVYKLPVNLPVTCPNRDGRLATGGCIFCGEEGAGFESLSCTLGVREQLLQNTRFIGEKYKADRFIVYFQNYSNTYLPLERFKQYIDEACGDNVAAIYISTRPDCINDSYLGYLQQVKEARGIDIVMELGLQTVNYHTLHFLNRGHGLAEFIDAVIRINRHTLEACAHYITDLPMDSREDVAEGARILSALGVRQVKCHSLFILKDTKLGGMYEKGELVPVPVEEFLERLVVFLEYLDPSIVIQRLLGRAPEERSLFCNWNTSWWKLRDQLEEKMKKENRYQGRLFNYLNGSRCLV